MENLEVTEKAIANLDRVLTERGMSRAELGRLAGLQAPDVSRLFRTKRASIGTLAAVAGAVGLHLSELVGTLVPLLGVVSAGDGADEPIDDDFLRVNTLYPDGTVAYLVSGTSMEDALIANGDYVLVRPQPQAALGETVVVWHPEKGTVVKINRKGHYASANARQGRDPLPKCDGCREYGVLVGVIRKC